MKSKLFLIAIASFLVLSCSSLAQNSDKKIKNILIGTWSGSEDDNQKQGMTKYWITVHNTNGTFIRTYMVIKNCEVENFIDKGKWKFEDGLYYETFESDGKTDIYTLEILDDDNVKFKAKEISLEMNNKEYEFIETRQE
jgi:hypothetical protein